MASTLTLSDIIGETRQALNGDTAAYPDALLSLCIKNALRELNGVTGVRRTATIDATGGYELDATDLLPAMFNRVWFPYIADSAGGSPGGAPVWVKVEEIEPGLLRSRDVIFTAGYVARVFYTAPHAINGLAGAVTTTLEESQIGEVISGAAAAAAWARAQAYASTVNANRQVTLTLIRLHTRKRDEFEAALLRYAVQKRQVKVREIGAKPARESWPV